MEDTPFQQLLRGRRDRCNALFAEARRAHPSLDAGEFLRHLRETVGPVVDAVAAHSPARGGPLLDALYEISLELAARGHLSRYPVMGESWQRLLPGVAPLLPEQPRALVGSLANALYHLAEEPGARVGAWADGMCALAATCSTSDELLEAGKVVAWRCGMAHFREGALETLASLPPALAAAALDIPVERLDQPLLNELRRNPWRHPEQDPAAPTTLSVVARVGEFRGFGGHFLTPPRGVASQGRFYVADAEACWLLHADVFGHTLRRVGETLPAPDALPGRATLDAEGMASVGGHRAAFPSLREHTSTCGTENTLAVTVPWSHAVYLIAPAA